MQKDDQVSSFLCLSLIAIARSEMDVYCERPRYDPISGWALTSFFSTVIGYFLKQMIMAPILTGGVFVSKSNLW